MVTLHHPNYSLASLPSTATRKGYQSMSSPSTHPTFLAHAFPAPHFTAEEQSAIFAEFTRVEFTKYSPLLSAGQSAGHYWFIESGFARSYAISPEGNDVTTGFFCAGDIVIDWPSFFLRQPTRESIEALEDCVTWQIGYEAFQKLFHTLPTFRDNGRTVLVGSYFELKRHSVALIVDSAADRYSKLVQERPMVAQQAPLKHIATYLGVTDTSLSRIRRELAKAPRTV
jgi:CRP-like cAMP-binding protein